jgi:uncharacterized protein YceK
VFRSKRFRRRSILLASLVITPGLSLSGCASLLHEGGAAGAGVAGASLAGAVTDSAA